MLNFQDFAFGNIVAYNLQGVPILGDIELLWATKLPLSRNDLVGLIVFRGHQKEEDGKVDCLVNVRFVGEGKNENIAGGNITIDSNTTWHKDELEIKHLLVPMPRITFDLPGSYIVEAVVNGEIVAELPLEVEQRPAQSR